MNSRVGTDGLTQIVHTEKVDVDVERASGQRLADCPSGQAVMVGAAGSQSENRSGFAEAHRATAHEAELARHTPVRVKVDR